jgi:hypothetical protein
LEHQKYQAPAPGIQDRSVPYLGVTMRSIEVSLSQRVGYYNTRMKGVINPRYERLLSWRETGNSIRWGALYCKKGTQSLRDNLEWAASLGLLPQFQDGETPTKSVTSLIAHLHRPGHVYEDSLSSSLLHGRDRKARRYKCGRCTELLCGAYLSNPATWCVDYHPYRGVNSSFAPVL